MESLPGIYTNVSVNIMKLSLDILKVLESPNLLHVLIFSDTEAEYLKSQKLNWKRWSLTQGLNDAISVVIFICLYNCRTGTILGYNNHGRNTSFRKVLKSVSVMFISDLKSQETYVSQVTRTVIQGYLSGQFKSIAVSMHIT